MIELVVGSCLVALLPIVLTVCFRILWAAAGALVWREHRPLALNHHATRSLPKSSVPTPPDNRRQSRSECVLSVLTALALGFGVALA